MVDLDNTKNYVYIEDNGDGTVTQTINIPEAGVIGMTILVAMPFHEMMVGAADTVMQTRGQGGYIDQAMESATLIPDSPEENPPVV